MTSIPEQTERREIPWAQIVGLCVDLDGTLADSEGDVIEGFARALLLHGRIMAPDERNFVVGHGFGEVCEYLERTAPLGMPYEVFEEEVLAAREAIGDERGVVELPGARAFVQRAARQKPCALVTGSTRREAELTLAGLTLHDCFKATLCAGEYAHGKPDPEPYLRAAAALGVAPEFCLAVEDSRAGIAAARPAGMFCVAVRAGNRYGQDQSAADLIVDTLDDLSRLLGL